jgi:hypothetical protein
MVARARRANWFKWPLGTRMVQNFLKRRIEKTVKGPSAAKRGLMLMKIICGSGKTGITLSRHEWAGRAIWIKTLGKKPSASTPPLRMARTAKMVVNT